MSTSRINLSLLEEKKFDRLTPLLELEGNVSEIKSNILSFLVPRDLHQLGFTSKTLKKQIDSELDFRLLKQLKPIHQCAELKHERYKFPSDKVFEACDTLEDFINVFMPNFKCYLNRKRQYFEEKEERFGLDIIPESVSIFLKFWYAYHYLKGTPQLPPSFNGRLVQNLFYFIQYLQICITDLLYEHINNLNEDADEENPSQQIAEIKKTIDKGAHIEYLTFCSYLLEAKFEKAHHKTILKSLNDVFKAAENATPPLITAAKYNLIPVVELLLEQGADVETLCSDFKTPLAYAAEEGHLDLVRLLVEKYRADTDFLTSKGHALLGLSLLKNNEEVSHYLYTHTSKELLVKTLFLMVRRNRPEGIKFIFEKKGITIKEVEEIRNKQGDTLLIAAIKKSHTASACVLIDLGINLDAKGADNTLALIHALQRKMYLTAWKLINSGCDKNEAWILVKDLSETDFPWDAPSREYEPMLLKRIKTYLQPMVYEEPSRRCSIM